MLNYSEVIKKSNAFECAKKDIAGSRISHAYLFTYSDENYLLKFAESFAALLISNEDDFEKNSIRVEKHIHPDVMFYGLDDEKINVELVKTIIENAQVSPFEAEKKIFILAGVGEMNEASQNKILKTIEEPPKNTYFLMLAKGSQKLLPTVLSRVKQIELDTIPNEKIALMLEEFGVAQEKAEIYASCSNGDASFAEKLASDENFTGFFNDVVSCFFEVNGSRDVLKYSNIFSAKGVDKDEFFDIATLISRDILMILSGKENLVVCKNVMPKIKVIASSLTLSFASELVKVCLQSKKDLSLNANAVAVIDNFLFKLAEVKVKCRRL